MDPLHLVWAGALFLVLSIPYMALVHRKSRQRSEVDSRTSILSILNPPHTTLSCILHSRATPNQRLKHAFGLTNTFVSSSLDVHSSFKRHALELVRAATFDASGVNGRRLRDITAEAVQAFIPVQFTPESASSSKISEIPTVQFDSFIQGITLRAVVSLLLNVDAQLLPWDDVFLVTTSINTLWKLSKTANTPLPSALLSTANARLNSWMGGKCTFENPIDIIIPAYETMWRVVALTLAHVAFDEGMRATFADLAERPTPIQYTTRSMQEQSPESVVLEVLRLYPPTKRISREITVHHPAKAHLPAVLVDLFACVMPGVFTQQKRTVRADVEAAQRDVRVWGKDSDHFKPRRFEEEKHLRECIFAFGGGPVACVAKHWAPMAVAVVVAAVLVTLDGEGCEIRRGSRLGGREGWDGWEIVKVS